MSETWAVALMGAGLSILGGGFIFLAGEIRALREKLDLFVKSDHCKEDMAQHCHRLEVLEKEVRKNTLALVELKTYHK